MDAAKRIWRFEQTAQTESGLKSNGASTKGQEIRVLDGNKKEKHYGMR
jgi:hypothetical protein